MPKIVLQESPHHSPTDITTIISWTSSCCAAGGSGIEAHNEGDEEQNGAWAAVVVESGIGSHNGGAGTVWDHAVTWAKKVEPAVGSGQDGTWTYGAVGRGIVAERDRLDWNWSEEVLQG